MQAVCLSSPSTSLGALSYTFSRSMDTMWRFFFLFMWNSISLRMRWITSMVILSQPSLSYCFPQLGNVTKQFYICIVIAVWNAPLFLYNRIIVLNLDSQGIFPILKIILNISVSKLRPSSPNHVGISVGVLSTPTTFPFFSSFLMPL